MNKISTHVLDTARGKPAANVPVKLERKADSGEWRPIGAAHTDTDGRCAQLVPADAECAPGVYRLVFDTASYQRTENAATLYPLVEIVFTVRDGESHLHLPLLLGPFGYTTYRGS